MESDLDYFRRRAVEELLAYANTTHPVARKTHLDLANRYYVLVQTIDEQSRESARRRTTTTPADQFAEEQLRARVTLWL